MLTIIFAATTIICVLGWLKWKITALSLAYYLTKNRYPDPDEKEIRECTSFVIKNIFKDLIGQSDKN